MTGRNYSSGHEWKLQVEKRTYFCLEDEIFFHFFRLLLTPLSVLFCKLDLSTKGRNRIIKVSNLKISEKSEIKSEKKKLLFLSDFYLFSLIFSDEKSSSKRKSHLRKK